MAQWDSAPRVETPLSALYLRASTAIVMHCQQALKPLDPTAEST